MAARSPVMQFYDALASSPLLRGIPVQWGRKHLAETNKPRRIVLDRAAGTFTTATGGPGRSSAPPALCILNLALVAYIWAVDEDDGFAIAQRLIQSMARATARGSLEFFHDGSDDTSTVDGSLQGLSMVLRFGLRAEVARVPEQEATIREVDIDSQSGADVGPSMVIT